MVNLVVQFLPFCVDEFYLVFYSYGGDFLLGEFVCW